MTLTLAPELCYAGGAFHRDWALAIDDGRNGLYGA